MVVASIGPITTETLQAHGIRPDVIPQHPKMGQLMAAVAAAGPRLLGEKRGR